MKTEVELDIASYLNKIGAEKYVNYRNEPTLDVLNDIVNGHVTTIPYQNYNLFKSETLYDLSVDALQRKMVFENRGGMCFETSELLFHALECFGFQTSRVPVWVLNNKPYNASMPPSHNILFVKIDQKLYLVDVGFGYNSLRSPVDFNLNSTEEKIIQGEKYQLFCDEEYYLLNMWINNSWMSFYRFDRPLHFIDYEETLKVYRGVMFYPGIMPIRDLSVKIGVLTENGRVGFSYSYNEERKKPLFFQLDVQNNVVKHLPIEFEDFCDRVKMIVDVDFDQCKKKFNIE